MSIESKDQERQLIQADDG